MTGADDGARVSPRPDGGDRRAFLRRGATVAGALVWTAPVVQSLGPVAMASGSPPTADASVNGVGHVAAVVTCVDEAGAVQRYRVQWDSRDGSIINGIWNCEPTEAPVCSLSAVPLGWSDASTLPGFPSSAGGCADASIRTTQETASGSDPVETNPTESEQTSPTERPTDAPVEAVTEQPAPAAAPFDLEIANDVEDVVLRILSPMVADCYFDGGSAGAIAYGETCAEGTLGTGPTELRWMKAAGWDALQPLGVVGPERQWGLPEVQTPQAAEFGGGIEVPELPSVDTTP